GTGTLINQTYITNHKDQLRFNHIMTGDYLLGDVAATFHDGSPGKTYQDLKDLWAASTNTTIKAIHSLDYLYLQQTIQHSNANEFDIELDGGQSPVLYITLAPGHTISCGSGGSTI